MPNNDMHKMSHSWEKKTQNHWTYRSINKFKNYIENWNGLFPLLLFSYKIVDLKSKYPEEEKHDAYLLTLDICSTKEILK